jgi:hypothetical protein
MSYSDYGGLCWKFKDGEGPERYAAAEDASLHSVGPGDDRPLEKATGFKFDALLKADPEYMTPKAKGENDWLTIHAHHVVIGTLSGIGLINHKGSVWITINGETIFEYSWDDETFARFEFEGHEWAVEFKKDPYVSYNWIRYPDGTNYLAVGGYGVGEHWWLDDDNKVVNSIGDGYSEQYPTIQEWFNELISWYDSLKKDTKDMQSKPQATGVQNEQGDEKMPG